MQLELGLVAQVLNSTVRSWVQTLGTTFLIDKIVSTSFPKSGMIQDPLAGQNNC